MANKVQSSLTNRVEHVVAAPVQRDGINLQLTEHDHPLPASGIAGRAPHPTTVLRSLPRLG
jgi:hypothetical protein